MYYFDFIVRFIDMLKVAVVDRFAAQISQQLYRQSGVEIAESRCSDAVVEHHALGETGGAVIIPEARKRLNCIEFPLFPGVDITLHF